MIDQAHDLEALHRATERLLSAVASLDDPAVTQPSRLPGWSRGHVLAHLARNADALVNVIEGRPMYADAATREADIARDAERTVRDHLADLRTSGDLLRKTWSAETDWSRTVELRNGVTDSAARVPFRRWVEVELHHVDLGIGYELEDLPAEFVEREIAFLAERFAGHPRVPATTLGDGSRSWTTGGGPTGGPVRVEGPTVGLLGWLAGRRDGSALTVRPGPLPALPPL